MRLSRGDVEVEIGFAPLAVNVRRSGRRLVRDLSLRVFDGVAADQFVQWTEGVLPHEDRGDPVRPRSAHVAEPLADGARVGVRLDDGTAAELVVTLPRPDQVTLELDTQRPSLRLALAWAGHPEQRFTGLGARHGVRVDQAGRVVQLGADRRYTGPECPPDMLDVGGIPQGDYAPVPWVCASRGWAAWLETAGNGTVFELGDEVVVSARAAAGPLRLHLFCQPTPVARLRAYLHACRG
ncbi:MAG: hypothetical protein M3O90_00140, partial [Actinomycetota bacterium]|nr:hypothetical protein [Actinomycetota bacterium]